MSIKKYHNISYPDPIYYQKCALQISSVLNKFCRCIDILKVIIYTSIVREQNEETAKSLTLNERKQNEETLERIKNT